MKSFARAGDLDLESGGEGPERSIASRGRVRIPAGPRRKFMMVRRALQVIAGALTVLAMALPASAQITTGTVNGTVKDAQGGVVPGATVVLVSETQGTKSAPAVTNAAGDYIFPNVTGDTYSVEVTIEGFKTVTRKGVKVSGADRVAVQPITLEVG